MNDTNALDRGRAAWRAHRWRDVYATLSAADREAPLDLDDLEKLATAAYLVGQAPESAALLARAHQAALAQDDRLRAVRCAFWLGFMLQDAAERAQAAGWFARARRLLDETAGDCVERGYMQLPVALGQFASGDVDGACATFSEAAAIGDRFGDPDLANLARQGCGRALVRLGQTARGVALLDEVMAAVTAGALSPIITGTIYCSVLDACVELFDVHRAREWTEAFGRWCSAEQDPASFRGVCLVRRAEVLQLCGAWADAIDEARRACERLGSLSGQSAMGAALYQHADVHRLRGEFAESEQLYRQASHAGRSPQPGLAQLWLAQGRAEAAAVAIRGVMDEAHERRRRSRLLAACVDIMLGAVDVPAARAAADELATFAAALEVPVLRAMAAYANGAVQLAEADARGALASLKQAWSIWHDIDVPYESGRTRLLMGVACRQLGDLETADIEFDAARQVFTRLGARPDLARLENLASAAPAAHAGSHAGGLSAREIQVLRLVATGRTNRAIAKALGISEKTVARHVSNIFDKLNLSSRAAATAYAYEHHLM